MAIQKFFGKAQDPLQQLRLLPESLYDELGMTGLRKQERSSTDLFYMTKYFKTYIFFKNYSEEVIKQCCRVNNCNNQFMKYEVLQYEQILYKRSELLNDEDKKLYLIISGEIGIYLNRPKMIRVLKENKEMIEQIEIMTIRDKEHFGSQLFILSKEDYFEISGLIVKCKKTTRVATLNQQHFNQTLINLEISRTTAEISKLYEFKIFNQISYVLLKKFYINSFKFTYQYLDKVYHQNQSAEVVYLILNGQFELRKTINQEPHYLGILSAGELIGEHEIMSNIPIRQHTIVCVSEQGELLAFDSQFFRQFVYQMIRHNVEQVIETKINFHQQDKMPLKQKLKEISQFCSKKTSFSNIQKNKKLHYMMKPRKEIVEDDQEKDSYYDLFKRLYDSASKSTNKANGDRQRRISHFLRNTLHPIQEKQKLNQSQISIIENINDTINLSQNPFNNQSLIRALSRKTFSKTFSKTRSVLNSEEKPLKPKQVATIDLNHSPNFLVARQYKSVSNIFPKFNIQ